MEPEYGAAIKGQVRQAGLESQVDFWGVLDEKRLASLLHEQHVLAVPSFYEGFGIAYLEGMGFGLPAIASTAGAAGEIISHRQNGFLVPPGDPAALTECLEVLYHSPDLRAKMGGAALARYHTHPTWRETGMASRDFLQDLTK
jgi:glycosyltransferase involved in cell wall biosynthesis